MGALNGLERMSLGRSALDRTRIDRVANMENVKNLLTSCIG